MNRFVFTDADFETSAILTSVPNENVEQRTPSQMTPLQMTPPQMTPPQRSLPQMTPPAISEVTDMSESQTVLPTENEIADPSHGSQLLISLDGSV